MSSDFFGLIPKKDQFTLESRKKVSESIATQLLILDPVKDLKKTQKLIRYLVKRNADILSIGIKDKSGEVISESSNHKKVLQDHTHQKNNNTHLNIPLIKNGDIQGSLELRFAEIKPYSLANIHQHPLVKLSIFIFFMGFFVYLAFILRITAVP